MAGAGYKLFNTGDVLTAAQVNTYLMEQTVMVFANAAARTTALSGVVSEGMISYLKDTNAVEVYDGANWVSSDDPNAIQNTIVDAKGDLITATANDVPARLAVGTNHAFLKSLSSTTTGLEWTSDWTTYTSVWASDGGTNPTLGNTVINAKYMRIGKLCAFYVDLTRGSTASNGTGTYKFSLPFSYAPAAPLAVGTFYAEDNGVAGYVGILTLVGGDSVLARVPTNSPVGATSPFTWGTNDFIKLSGVYEVA